MRLSVRLHHAWAVFTGRVRLPTTIEGLIFMTALAKTDAALAALQTAATALINSHGNSTAQVAATAQALTEADNTVSAQLDALTSQITAVLPTSDVPAADASASDGVLTADPSQPAPAV